MINDIKKLTLVLIFIAAFFVQVSPAADLDAAVKILDSMPVNDSNLEYELNKDLVKAGPNPIKAICTLIVPPGTGDDTKARYAISSLVSYTSRPGASAEKKMLEGILVEALEKAKDKEVKSFFISQLQFIADDSSVPVISYYLSDPRLCERASFALQTIGTQAAAKSFLNALPSATESTLPTIVYALGRMRVKDAVSVITKHASSGDRDLRLISLKALAQIGDQSSIKVFDRAIKTKDSFERSNIASSYVLLAETLNKSGSSKDAYKISRAIYKSRDDAINSSIKSAALFVIVDSMESKADDFIEDAFNRGDDRLKAAAMKIAAKIDDPSIIKVWGKKLRRGTPEDKIMIADMLSKRTEEKAVQEYLLKAYNDDDTEDEVKTAILKAVFDHDVTDGKPDASVVLASAIRTGSKSQVLAAKELLLQIPTDTYQNILLGSLPKTSADGQIAVIEILAERNVWQALEEVFVLTSSKDENVSIAATKALAKLAGPGDISRVINIALNTQSSSQRLEASQVVTQLASQIVDRTIPANQLIAAMKGADQQKTITILKLLPDMGTKEALEVVVRQTKSRDSDIMDTAIRSLANWTNDQAIEPLYRIAADKNQPINYHVIALKAYADLSAESKADDIDKVGNLKKAMKIARNTQVKGYAVSRLGQVKSIDALKFAVSLLDDKEVSASAAQAVSRIALPDGRGYLGLKASGVGTLLFDAYIKIPNKKIREKIDAHLKTLAQIQSKTTDQTEEVKPPKGFVRLFNGRDLTGWKGLLLKPNDNPYKRAKLNKVQLAAEQAKADESMRSHWHVVDGILYFDGQGHSLATATDYGDFEMLVDWKLMHDNGDSGIYLRGTPQVQIWDPAHHKGVGSGGLYNNKQNPSEPTVTADKPIGQWNTFRIKMIGENVTVHLNGKLVVDNVPLENYWQRGLPVLSKEQIELQCHGNPVCFRNIFIKQLPRENEFISLFNGRDLAGWVGDTKGYVVEDGKIVCKPGGNLYTEKQYSDFILRFKFKLTDGANNGLGIRTPIGKGVNPAYQGMELQIIDNRAEKYKDIKPYQKHGSIYGIKDAREGFLKPTGQWNSQEVKADGNMIIVELNNVTILEQNIKEAVKGGTMDGRDHPGLFNKKGHIGFLGHGSVVEFKDIEIMEIRKALIEKILDN